jgi:hypothetical protein
MKKTIIQISFPTERLEAVRHYTADRGGDLNQDLEEALQKLYERAVPKDVRAFLEVREAAASAEKPPRPPRHPRPAEQQNPRRNILTASPDHACGV